MEPITRAAYSANIVAFILGGGKGSRIYPLTRDRSKPALPMGGKYRIIDIPISNCINSGIRKIFVATQFNSKSLHHHINSAYRFDNFSSSFVEVLAAQQTTHHEGWYEGTADAIRKNLKCLDSHPECETILVLSGDQIYRMDFMSMYQTHLGSNADLTVATLPVSQEKAGHFGILKARFGQSHHKIVDFIEKPKNSEAVKAYKVSAEMLKKLCLKDAKKTFFASMGIYMFKKSVLYDFLKGSKDLDFGHDVIPNLIKNSRVVPYFFDGYWEDIGTIKAFHQAHMELLNDNPKFKFWDPIFPIYTNPRFLPPAYIRTCEIENCILGDGTSVMGSKLKNCVVGVRSQIRNDVMMENTVMLGADWFETSLRSKPGKVPIGIGVGTVIKQSIIDKNVRIGKNVQILNEKKLKNFVAKDESYVISEGITVIPKGTVIADNTII